MEGLRGGKATIFPTKKKGGENIEVRKFEENNLKQPEYYFSNKLTTNLHRTFYDKSFLY